MTRFPKHLNQFQKITGSGFSGFVSMSRMGKIPSLQFKVLFV